MTTPAWLTECPFAHRGLHDTERPENSLAAVAAAVDAGYPVEIDVRLTADGKVVVFHDESLRRMTGHEGTVEGTASRDLADLRLGSSGEKIPLLEAVLDLTRGRVAALLEIKSRGRAGSLEEHVARIVQRWSTTPIAVMSFNPLSLVAFANHAPNVLRGQLACRFDTDPMPGWQKFLLANYLANVASRPHFLAHQWDHLPAVVPTLLRLTRRMPILGWTCRSAADEQRARPHVDNIIFEGYRAAKPGSSAPSHRPNPI